MNLLQEFILLPLDIFCKIRQNKGIETMNQLEAWLTFFSTDRPEDIIELIEHFPQFRPLYEDVYAQCRNVEGVMEVYSKELRELDRNTVQYMIERLQKELDDKNAEMDEKDAELSKIIADRDAKDAEITRLKALLTNVQSES